VKSQEGGSQKKDKNERVGASWADEIATTSAGLGSTGQCEGGVRTGIHKKNRPIKRGSNHLRRPALPANVIQ